MSTAKKLISTAGAAAAAGDPTYVDDVFSTYVYKGTAQRTKIKNYIKLGNGPENGTQLHLTGDNLIDSAPVVSTITNNNSVAVSTSVKKYGTGSLEFQNTRTLQFDQSADLKFPDGKHDFTVEGWVYMNDIGSFRCMFSLGVPFQIYINNNTATFYAAENISSSYIGVLNGLTGTTNAITSGAWHHVAVVRHGDEFSIYTNGTRTTPVTYSGNIFSGPTGTIGGYTSTQYLFATGGSSNYIDDFRISDRAVYTENFTPPASAHSLDSLVTGEGGLVWLKRRAVGTNKGHHLYDTARGVTKMLSSDGSDTEETKSDGLKKFSNDGFSIGTESQINGDTSDNVGWTFRKQPGFCDIVTWTGNGVSGREIPHSLGSVPGMILVKNLDLASDWRVFHRSLGPTKNVLLNGTNAALTQTGMWNDTAPTSTVFTVGNSGGVNGNTSTYNYVAYVFAHDAQNFGENSNESIIKCGSYTGNGNNTGPIIDLGFEPQWVIIKDTSAGSTDWFMFDTTRNWNVVNASELKANTPALEAAVIGAYAWLKPLGNGFQITDAATGLNTNGNNHIYMAIRRPNKPASEFAATALFNTVAGRSDGVSPSYALGMMPDMGIQKSINGSSDGHYIFSRLTGPKYMFLDASSAESTGTSIQWDYMNGMVDYFSSAAYNAWGFRRAPGFFDVVAFTAAAYGTDTIIDHNLGVTPELVITKSRESATSWYAWHKDFDLANGEYISVSSNQGSASLGSTYPVTLSSTQVNVDTFWQNYAGDDMIAYLFASVNGISKIGTYTGTGNDLDVNCGFTNGARFVLVKRTDSSGDWYMWDSLRGIVAGNDPYLLINQQAAQVTNQDYIDPLSSGFTITSSAPAALNNSGGTYIFYAIA